MTISSETLQLLSAAAMTVGAAGMPTEASTIFAAVEAYAEKDDGIGITKGLLLTKTGRAAEAIDGLTALVEASPSNIDAKVVLAVALHVDERIDQRNRVAQDIVDADGATDEQVAAARELLDA